MMLFTYVLYIFLLLFLVVLTRLSFIAKQQVSNNTIQNNTRNTYKLFLLVGLLGISFLVAIRYQVGVDWEGYVKLYKKLTTSTNYTFDKQSFEIGYFTLSKTISQIGLGYQYLFFIVTFISWLYIFKSIELKFLSFFLVFLFFDEWFFWSMNGVRQFTAISTYLYAFYLISNGFRRKAIIPLIIGSLFHKSIYMIIPLLYIPIGKIYNKRIFLIVFVLSLTLLNNSFLFEKLDLFLEALNIENEAFDQYSSYKRSGNFKMDEVKIGLGFYFKIILNFIIVFYSDQIIKDYPRLKHYFVLFFIGTIIFNLFYTSQLIGRLNNYFLILRPYLLAFIFYTFSRANNKTKFIATYIMCFLFFILFLKSISGSSNLCAPYQFLF